MEFPEGHPLEGKDPETHADHLRAYAEVLEEADPEEVHGAMLVLTGPDGTDTLPTVSMDTDPRWASIWMLGAHLHHVTMAARESGDPELSMEEVAQDAINAMENH